MLKKIPTPQAELGMFLQSMEGSWLSHPFWKTKFLLADPADLAALKKSGVPYIWIDVAKGRDLLSGGAAPAAAAPLSAATPAEPAQAAGAKPASTGAAQSTSMADELEQATAALQRSRKAVMGMLNEARLGRSVSRDEAALVVDDIASSVWRNPSTLISLARLKTKRRLHLHALGGRVRHDDRAGAPARHDRDRSNAWPARPACCTTWARWLMPLTAC
jgi:hypothetical protein